VRTRTRARTPTPTAADYDEGGSRARAIAGTEQCIRCRRAMRPEAEGLQRSAKPVH